MGLTWLFVDRQAPSDEEVVILEIFAPEAESVSQGQQIAELEGSKNVFDMAASSSGVIFWFAQVGDTVAVGAPIAAICEPGEPRPNQPPAVKSQNVAGAEVSDESSSRFSANALKLAREIGLDFESFQRDKEFITVSDIEEHLGITSSPENVSSLQQRLAFIGGGRAATLAIEVVNLSPGMRVVGIWDKFGNNSLDVFGIDNTWESEEQFLAAFQNGEFDAAVITIGSDMESRKTLNLYCAQVGVPLASLVHPEAHVASTAQIGEGCMVMAGARIGPHAKIARNVLVSSNSNIDHHCWIGENSTFGPTVALSGAVHVGKNCVLGTMIGVEPNVKIGDNVTVASGAILSADVPESSIVKVSQRLHIRGK